MSLDSPLSMKMPTDPIQVFCGQVSNMRADLYLRLPEPPERWKHVEVKGPYCKTARTLPTVSRFERLGDGSGLWRAQIIDPACWSLDHPMLYRVRVEADATSEAIQIECGVRRFGCKDGNFWWDGNRWVLRGAWCEHVRETELSAWKAARMAMCIDQPDAALLHQASQHGIMLVVDLGERAASDDVISITHSPAVMLVIVSDDTAVEGLRGLLPNIVIAKRYDPVKMEQPPADADALLIDAGGQLPSDLTACGNRPVFAVRASADPIDEIAVARAACDQLQRDLADRYDLSGYMV